MRRHLVREIKRRVDPHLRESGFRSGPIGKSRPTLVYAFKRAEGYKVRGYVLEQIHGFTDFGVIVDTGYMITVLNYEQIPAEDLMIVLKYAERAATEAARGRT